MPSQAPESAADTMAWAQQILQHPTILAAFLGFFGGVLIKFLLDLWMDWIRRRRDANEMAAELHAELGWLWDSLKEAAETVDKLVTAGREGSRKDRDAYLIVPDRTWVKLKPPDMITLERYLGRLGLLRGLTPDLVRLRGRLKHIGMHVEEAMHEYKSGEKGSLFPRLVLIKMRLLRLERLIRKLNIELSNISKQKPHDFKNKVERP